MKRINLLSYILLFLPVAVFAQQQASLESRLDALLKQDLLKTSEVGILIYDLTAGKKLYGYQDKKLYRPASIEKLITGIAGLSRLGADYRFETSLYHTGTIEGDTLFGDLYVVGRFDPEFDDMALDSLVRVVANTGISAIKGSLYGDVSMMDSLYWGSGWSWDDTPYSFQPYLSPLMFCKGSVEITAYPTQKDSIAYLTCSPLSTYYTVANQTVSNAPATGKLQFTRNWLDNGNEILVRGNVSSIRKDWVNMYKSQDFFMHTFRERLQSKGISTPSGYSYSECPMDTTSCLLSSYYHQLSEVLEPMMKKSDNLCAEAVFYHLALNDTLQKNIGSKHSCMAIEAFIDSLGLQHKDYRIADGSGVSLYNYVSPELIVAFLKYAYSNEAVYDPLYKALPIAGIDGTLSYRMKDNKAYKNVRAKTGTVAGVCSLAGYARAGNGHKLAFVIINQNVLEARKARAFQDRVCGEMCR